MILGTGSDLLDIRRFEKVMGRFEKRFIRRCFTEAEIETAERRRPGGTHLATYAKRFAAKEAVAKALGTGIAKGVNLKDIGVVNDENGKPSVVLTGGALRRLKEITPAGQQAVIHLTLTDEPPTASAYVTIESI